jgi:chemotaxis protein histidine kinase CheA
MVYGNVRQMGGAVTVKSARNCGATFNVHLPVATLVASRAAHHSSRQEA